MPLEVITFGCRLNNYESDIIKTKASNAGLDNTVIFNSCAVTSEAERQLRQAIRKAKRDNPDVKIIVTGCAAQINPERYSKMPEVDQVIGNMEKLEDASFFKIAAGQSEKVVVNDIMSVRETAHQLIDSIDNKTRAFLQVQNGCNHRCTFCIIPFGRGNSRSVSITNIVDQARILVAKGFKEIVITGVDVTDYGLDLPGKPSLGHMLKRLLNLVPGLPRLRLSSIDVAEIDNDLLDLLKNEQRLMPHFHLSLQSGDNMILKRMKRRHTREQVLDFCNAARTLRPDVVFGADIIAGFPTETDEMFLNTVNIVEEADLLYLHVFPYSEREGTPAAKMPQVEKAIRKERAKVLRELGSKKQAAHLGNQVGKVVEVLVEQDQIGRTPDFSMVKLDQEYAAGSLIQVEITKATAQHLEGRKVAKAQAA